MGKGEGKWGKKVGRRGDGLKGRNEENERKNVASAGLKRGGGKERDREKERQPGNKRNEKMDSKKEKEDRNKRDIPTATHTERG